MLNLQTGCVTQPRDDVAFHLSVRNNEHAIVRNHMVNQVWGTEERFGGMPLHPGQHFDLLILAEATAFKVAINGTHFCMFQYRIPYHRIQFINIEGDVTVHSITLEGDNYQPPTHTHPHHPQPPMHVPVAPIYPNLSGPPQFPPHISPRPPHWTVGAVPVLPVHGHGPTPPPPPPPSYSPYPPHHHETATAYGPSKEGKSGKLKK